MSIAFEYRAWIGRHLPRGTRDRWSPTIQRLSAGELIPDRRPPDVLDEMPEHECSSCGVGARIPEWERIFRCPQCGARETLPLRRKETQGPALPIALPRQQADPTSTGETATGAKIACAACGMFVNPARTCSE